MKLKTPVNCQIPQDAYIYEYPEAAALAKLQRGVFWPPEEIKVEKDIQDMMVNMEPPERFGTTFLLKMFVKYEIFIGNEYWGNRVMKMFPKPCIQMMANCFSFFEINVHAPFYNQLNEALHLNTEEFYNSYTEDSVLVDRMDFLDKMVSSKDDLLSLAVFSMIEGAVLYSAFAFFKHFQSKGKNKLMNVVRGINFSVRDENIHCIGGALCYNIRKNEEVAALKLQWKEASLLDKAGYVDPSTYQYAELEEKIKEAAMKIYEHECHIIDTIFSKGPIEGITDIQLKHFVESRLNICLKQLGIPAMFMVTYNPIAEWFYEGINAYQLNDFFTSTGREYSRNWSESAFTWKHKPL
ncbi:MAG: ribonucleotide-diphosphate reductase subunit beta [Candidatus Izemoplasma sp.]